MIKSLPLDRVCAFALALSGESDSTVFSPFCESAVFTLLSRVKPSASREKWEDGLVYAAACLAFYRYTLSRGCDNVAVYKAGDVNIQNKPDGARLSAKELLHDALLSVDGCLKHSAFCFKTV